MDFFKEFVVLYLFRFLLYVNGFNLVYEVCKKKKFENF